VPPEPFWLARAAFHPEGTTLKKSARLQLSIGVPVFIFALWLGPESVATSPAANCLDATVNWPMFHGDRMRTGWNSSETILTPANVASAQFGKVWDTGALDSYGGTAAHLYASPLYVDDVVISAPPFTGLDFSVVIAASSNSYVYAINAFDGNGVSASTVLWSTFLGPPGGGVDGARLGILGTPVIDLNATPPVLYVASDTTIASVRAWRVFALDLTSGQPLSNWPLVVDDSTVSPVNQNPTAMFQSPSRMSQRGGLNLSWDGSLLYVPFGGYSDQAAGWMVAIDTTGQLAGTGIPNIISTYSSAPDTNPRANGGLWDSAGASVDASGNLYEVTGNAPTGPAPSSWGQSVLKWAPGVPLQLIGTYTPWNHCQMDDSDIDLTGSGATLLPDLDPTTTSTPSLMAVGGKQGNAYLIDRNNLPGSLTSRPACNRNNPTADPPDGSLWDPNAGRSYYGGSPGPLNVFGPYGDFDNNGNFAKARSTPAYFRASDGTSYVFYTGSTKTCDMCTQAIPPCVARVKVNTPGPGFPAYFSLDAYNNDPSVLFKSPGTPVISSSGSDNAIIWVLEPNVYRGDSLTNAPPPTLFAIDATTMQKLFASTTAQISQPGGKYNHPTVAHGVVFVGSDRITAFGLMTSNPQTLTTIADTYGRGGTYADQNFGSDAQINVKTNSDPNFDRDAYFKFDISALATVSSARVRFFGNTDSGGPVSFAAYAVGDDSWTESGLTWNNRPALGNAISTTITASGTSELWYELDITTYLQSELSSGHTLMTVALHADDNEGTRINIHSKESGSNPAQVVFTP